MACGLRRSTLMGHVERSSVFPMELIMMVHVRRPRVLKNCWVNLSRPKIISSVYLYMQCPGWYRVAYPLCQTCRVTIVLCEVRAESEEIVLMFETGFYLCRGLRAEAKETVPHRTYNTTQSDGSTATD